MAGLGIYSAYKRIKNEQELTSPVLPIQKTQGDTLSNKFSPEDMQRYNTLRDVVKNKQSNNNGK